MTLEEEFFEPSGCISSRVCNFIEKTFAEPNFQAYYVEAINEVMGTILCKDIKKLDIRDLRYIAERIDYKLD